jgi:hypothetical protein
VPKVGADENADSQQGETKMTEQQRLEIAVGMRVMVKVAAREIPATVVEVGENWFLVRSDSTGREFRTTRVVDILDAPETEDAEIAQAAADIADEEAATAELRSREENGEAADEAVPAEEPAAPPKPAKATKGKDAKAAKGKGKAKKAEEPPRKLSLANAAVEVLRQENKPLNTRELVKLATERGLWTPTACRTPEQSLYGAFFLEIKNSDSPRIKKSAERGKFELA